MNLVQLLGQNVRRERLHRGLTQDKLAEDAGMRRSYLSDLERGVRNPSVDALGRLAVALGVEAADLLRPLDPID
jgi:transcriptional regulator with XRE-family HTH domain